MFCVIIDAMALYVSFNSFYSYLLIFRENTVWKCSKLQKSCSGVSFSPEHISIFTWRNSHFLEFLQVNNENVFRWRKLSFGWRNCRQVDRNRSSVSGFVGNRVVLLPIRWVNIYFAKLPRILNLSQSWAEEYLHFSGSPDSVSNMASKR